MAGNPEGSKAFSVPAVGEDEGTAGFARKDGSGRGEAFFRSPSVDSVPEAVHASECGGIWGEKIGPVCENREEEALGNAVA